MTTIEEATRGHIPEDSVRAAFMRRDDIAPLSADEQGRRWAEHLEKIRGFLAFLAGQEPIAVMPGEGEGP